MAAVVRPSPLSRFFILAALSIGACPLAGCGDPQVLTIDVTTGHEDDAWSRDPAVTRIDVKALDNGGNTVASAQTEPGGSFELGEVPLDTFLHVEVAGKDASGAVRVRGRSLGLVVGALDGGLLPVFAQRVGRWSRPPDALSHSHRDGLAAVLGERYLLLTGGVGLGASAADVAFYDLLALGSSSGGTLDFAPRSLVMSDDGEAALFLDDEQALWLDFGTGTSTVVSVPEGLTGFAAIAGGRAVEGEDGSYLVGASRDDLPSDRVLQVNADRSLASATLTAARQGAAVAFVPDVGLVVVGGSDVAGGVEVLVAGESSATALDFDVDPVRGATAVVGALPDQLILLCGQTAGGDPAPVRSLDLRCASACAATELAIDWPVPLEQCFAYAVAGSGLLLVGQDGDGATRTFAVDLTGATVEELSLREPRRGAAVVPTPLGSLALLGGALLDDSAALTVETLMPE